MSPIFFDNLHNFGWTDDDMTQWKMDDLHNAYMASCPTRKNKSWMVSKLLTHDTLSVRTKNPFVVFFSGNDNDSGGKYSHC